MSSTRFPRALHALTFLLLATAVAGCGDSTAPKSGARITPELVRLKAGSGGPSAAMVAAAASWALEGVDGDAKFATTDLQITSLKLPITEIYLLNTATPHSHHAPVYTCSDGDCLVELATSSFERDLLQSSSVTVPVGVYDAIQFGYCRAGQTNHVVYLTASVNLGGTVYYTRADGSLATEAPAQPAAITLNGCATQSTMPYPVIVTDNGVVQLPPEGEDGVDDETVIPVGDAALRLYFTTEDIAWAAMGATHSLWFPGWCALPLAEADAGTPYACVGYPVVAAFLGRETIPTVERYSTNIATSLTLFTDDDAVYGGYLRRFLRSAADVEVEHLSATGALFGVSSNGDGSLNLRGHIADFGPEWAFPAFRRESHSGVYRNHDQIDRAYTATRLP